MKTTASTRRSILTAGIVCLTALAAAFTTEAATITWGAATPIAGDSDVSTNGTLVDAFNFGAPGTLATTVNGVNFAAFAYATASVPSVTLGNYTWASSAPINIGSSNGFGSGAGTFAGLSAAYRTLLSSGGGTGVGATATLTMSGLTVGETYEFQWWSNTGITAATTTTATAGNAVVLDGNTTNVDGGVGQFSIGTFIADNASQQIAFTIGNSVSVVNGFQLRQISAGPVSAVPEPGSALVGMLALGLCGLGTARRRRG